MITTGAGLSGFKHFSSNLARQEAAMPAFFVGHGSPMNGIELNEFSRKWQEIGESIPVPKAVLVISAHWLSRGTHITAMAHPETIHDFSGFPEALSSVIYPAPGSPQLAQDISDMLHYTHVTPAHDWGLDHGAWVVVKWMFPQADIPVLQLSIDYNQPAQWHYELGKELAALRKKGILIIGSGNIIHNLYMMDWRMINGGGYDWAQTFNDKINTRLLDNDFHDIIRYDRLGPEAKLAVPTPDHYFPMLYALGLKEEKEPLQIFSNKLVGGSLNMTSFRIG